MIRSLAQAAVQQRIKEANQQQAQQQAGRNRAEAQLARLRTSEQRRESRATLAPQPARSQDEAAPARSTARSESKRPQQEDNALFSALLDESDDVMTPLLAFGESGSGQQGFGELEETATQGGPPAMALWQEIEPALSAALHDVPPGEMMLTLMLPKLGNVDAHMAALPGGGWDIALHLQPGAWQALLPHQERCRLSLRQRMNSRVRLRFERRSPDEQEQAG
ncbi:type III secretion system HrpP C-terminal domain-containing protein [Erwinia oleae]|uniref:type III secretion system HrpP C-terminal domain-containing protein n=1 Tax=Erwinia oleae TaxID=796334 RepID=UPI0006921523|nr:type III secretion system HrpP C-terminal domain-containing protein [Erwinia oleae]